MWDPRLLYEKHCSLRCMRCLNAERFSLARSLWDKVVERSEDVQPVCAKQHRCWPGQEHPQRGGREGWLQGTLVSVQIPDPALSDIAQSTEIILGSSSLPPSNVA